METLGPLILTVGIVSFLVGVYMYIDAYKTRQRFNQARLSLDEEREKLTSEKQSEKSSSKGKTSQSNKKIGQLQWTIFRKRLENGKRIR